MGKKAKVAARQSGGQGKYHSHVAPRLAEIEQWCAEGLIDAEIARRLGIAPSTIRDYRKKHPAFAALMIKAKAKADYQVENALYKRALGYEFWEEVWERDIDGELILVKKTLRHISPNVGALIYWLNNRQRDRWRNRSEVEVGGNSDKPIEIKFTVPEPQTKTLEASADIYGPVDPAGATGEIDAQPAVPALPAPKPGTEARADSAQSGDAPAADTDQDP